MALKSLLDTYQPTKLIAALYLDGWNHQNKQLTTEYVKLIVAIREVTEDHTANDMPYRLRGSLVL